MLDGAWSHRRDGVGLGLAIVKRLAELHDADMVIDTRPGRGTAIRILFPAERNAGRPNTAAAEALPAPASAGPAASVGPAPAALLSEPLYGRSELLDALFAALPIGVAVVGQDDVLIHMNAAFCRLCGCHRGDLLGRPVQAFLPDMTPAEVFPAAPGAAALRERRLVRRSGGVRLVEVTVHGFRGLDGRPYSLLLVSDPTERRRAAQALRESEERFRLATVAARAGIWDDDLVSGESWVSPLYLEILGYAEGELTPTDAAWRERIHPDDRTHVDAAKSDHLARRSPLFEATYRMRHKDGHWIWVAARGAASFDPGGRPRRLVGTLTDITAEAGVREALAQKTRFLEMVLSSIAQGIAVVDRDLRVQLVNESFLRMYDFPPALGRSGTPLAAFIRDRIARGELPVELADGNDPGQVVERYLAQLVRPEEYRMVDRRPDGRIIELWHQPLPDGSFVITCTDITERERANAALRESEQYLLRAQRIARVGWWKLDTAVDQAARWSDILYDICGRDRASFAPTFANWRETIHPDDFPAAARALRITQGQGVREYRVIRPDGETRHVYDEFVIDTDPQRKRVRIFGIVQDITERKLQELALAESEAQLRAVLDVAVTGIITLDHQGTIDLFNPAAERMFGWTAAEVRGGSVTRLLPSLALRDGPAADGLGMVQEMIGVRRDGSRFPAHVAVDKFVARGRPMFVVVAADISALKQRERELSEARDRLVRQAADLEQAHREADAARLRAEAASRAKSEFIAHMSHELRPPLNAILGFSEIILREYFGPLGSSKYRDYINDIYQSGQHLLTLINDVLDLSCIEAGQYRLEEEPVDLRHVVEGAVRLLRERAVSKALTISVTLDPTVGVLADARALRQVMVNLLGNAVKFTPSGGRIAITSSRDADGGIRLSVCDTGIGIPRDEVPRVMAAFGQAKNAGVLAREGVGLGLAIVGSLVKLHGGTIEIDSDLDQGTTVSIRLPPERTLALMATLPPLGFGDSSPGRI